MNKQHRVVDQYGNAVAVVDWSAFETTTRPPAALRRKRLFGIGAVLLSSVAAVALVTFALQGRQAAPEPAVAEAPPLPFGQTQGIADSQGAPQASVGPAWIAAAPQGNAQAPVIGMPGMAGTKGAPPGTAETAGAPQAVPSVPGASAVAIAPQATLGGGPTQGAPQASAGVGGMGTQPQGSVQAPTTRMPGAPQAAAENAQPQAVVSEAPGATAAQARILTDIVRFTSVELGDLRVVSGWRYASATDATPTNSFCTVRLPPRASGVLAATHIPLATQQGSAGAVILPWSAGSMPGLTERDHQRALAACTWFK